MRTVMVAGMVLALGQWAYAQGDRDRMSEWMLERMKERLGLSDEQVARIKEIAQQSREAEEKLQKERDEKVKALLTDEQKQQYDEFRRNPWGGRGGGGPGGGMQGWLDRFLAPALDQLKKELNLTDEQAEKVKQHIESFNQKARERFEEMRQNGFQGLNWQEEMQKFQDRVKEMTENIKTHLSDEQKEKLDKLIQERFAFGAAPRGGERREERRRPSVDERVRRVMEALRMQNAEEAAAVRDAVKRIVEAQVALEDYEHDARGKVDELSRKADATDDDIQKKLDELRNGRKEKDRALKDAQKSLAEIVSYRQELELIKHGVLR